MAKVGERVSWIEGDYRLVGELLDFDHSMHLVLVLDDEGNFHFLSQSEVEQEIESTCKSKERYEPN
jgi:hypothetical protein